VDRSVAPFDQLMPAGAGWDPVSTRKATAVNDAAARTRSRNVTATGFDGGTRTDGDVSSRNVTATCDFTNKVWSKDVSVDRADRD